MLLRSSQVGAHSDSLVAEAVLKGFTGFDLDLAWEAVHKDATVPPVDDWTITCAISSCVSLCSRLIAATDILTGRRCII